MKPQKQLFFRPIFFVFESLWTYRFSTHRCMRTGVCRPFERFMIKLVQCNIVCSLLTLFPYIVKFFLFKKIIVIFVVFKHVRTQSFVSYRRKHRLSTNIEKSCGDIIATIAYEARQKFNRCSTLSGKIIYSHLTTVLLWCLGLEKIGFSQLPICRPPPLKSGQIRFLVQKDAL